VRSPELRPPPMTSAASGTVTSTPACKLAGAVHPQSAVHPQANDRPVPTASPRRRPDGKWPQQPDMRCR
jgi:hypothetical protein